MADEGGEGGRRRAAERERESNDGTAEQSRPLHAHACAQTRTERGSEHISMASGVYGVWAASGTDSMVGPRAVGDERQGQRTTERWVGEYILAARLTGRSVVVCNANAAPTRDVRVMTRRWCGCALGGRESLGGPLSSPHCSQPLLCCVEPAVVTAESMLCAVAVATISRFVLAASHSHSRPYSPHSIDATAVRGAAIRGSLHPSRSLPCFIY